MKNLLKRIFTKSDYEQEHDVHTVPRFGSAPGGDFSPRLGPLEVGPGDAAGTDFARRQVEAWEAPLPPEPDDPTQLPRQPDA